MAWQDAKALGETWAEKNLPADLRGQVIQLVTFESDRDALFFYPDRTSEFQAMIMRALAREVRKRKGKTSYMTLTADRYREWLQAQGKRDTDATRLAFAESLVGKV